MAITKLVSDSLGTGVGGKILQVVSVEVGGQKVSTSSTYADAGIATSITPSSTNSKIYILMTLCGCRKWSSNYMSIKIQRQINSGGYSDLIIPITGFGYTGTSVVQTGVFAFNYLDTTNTTSQIDYKIQFRSSNTDQVNINTDTNDKSTLTLMEIA